jgi:hypothetical protein
MIIRRGLVALPVMSFAAACSGGGPETISAGTNAPPAASQPASAGSGSGVTAGSSAGSGSGASAGSGSGVTAGTGTGSAPQTNTHFLDVSAEKSFDAIGGAQSLSEANSGATLYRGNAATVRSPSGQISYNPRDGIFTVTLADTKAGVSSSLRFQDPAHRTDFNPYATPQWGVPNFEGFNYLESINDTPTDVSTFFYQRPGTSTTYVTLAGYVRNKPEATATTFERGAFVFGDQTVRGQIPASGTGTYTGGFIATMVNNPTFDSAGPRASYLQWLQGSSTVAVDFGKGTVNVGLSGTVNPANMNGYQISNSQLSIPTGASFTASATAAINLVGTGGFAGKFDNASFAWTPTGATSPVTRNVEFTSAAPGSSTAGASSVDGTFFGPNAANVGGSFRVVGGVPDQRVDILGAFTGARK